MMHSDEIRTVVKDKYNQLAREKQDCCGTADCSFIGESYTGLEGYVQDADLGLGCGLPTKYAGIRPGHTVLDLGSGAGNDVFIARREVGDTGRVIGLDFAEDMLAKANINLQKLGYQNVEFLSGDIEDIPLPDDTADVVVSNCVMNLVPDKQRAYAETFRVLKPGGHFCISDVVIKGELPEDLRQAAELYAGCVSGAMPVDEYMNVITASGFTDLSIEQEHRIDLSNDLLREFLSEAQIEKLIAADTGIYSVTVKAMKPAEPCCGSDCC